MSWKKFTAFNSSPTSQTYPELPQNITYLRLFLGLAYGISLAFRENIPGTTINGPVGLLFGCNIVTFLPIVYMNFYLNVTSDTYVAQKQGGGSGSGSGSGSGIGAAASGLNFVGVVNGMATMILVWVVFFTLLHEDEEKILTGALLKTVMNAATTGMNTNTNININTAADESIMATGEIESDVVVNTVEDSEF